MKSLKLFLITGVIAIAQSAFAGYGTNLFFVSLGERSSVVTPEAIENAKTNIGCLPVENDPTGHWGKQ